MNPFQLQLEIDREEAALRQKKAQLDAIRRACNHDWHPVVYDPIHTPGFHDPGDAHLGGVVGLGDRHLPADYPPTTTPRWRRSCKKCGLTQETQHTRKQPVAGRIAGTTAQEEVPAFPS